MSARIVLELLPEGKKFRVTSSTMSYLDLMKMHRDNINLTIDDQSYYICQVDQDLRTHVVLVEDIGLFEEIRVVIRKSKLL